MAIAGTTVTSSATAMFTASGAQAIVSITLCNYDDSNAETVTIYAVPSGQSVADQYMIINDLSIASKGTVALTQDVIGKLILANGDTVQADGGSGSRVSCVVSSIAL